MNPASYPSVSRHAFLGRRAEMAADVDGTSTLSAVGTEPAAGVDMHTAHAGSSSAQGEDQRPVAGSGFRKAGTRVDRFGLAKGSGMAHRNERWFTARVGVVVLAGLLAGCGFAPTQAPAQAPTPTPSTSTSSSNSSALCASLRQLGTSMRHLLAVDVAAVGTDSLNASVSQVWTDLLNVSQDAQATLGPQIEALRTALDTLRTTVAGLTDQASVRAALPVLSSELAAVASSWQALERQAVNACP